MAAKRGKARIAILEHAEALVKRHGADSVSVEAVAAAAGAAKGLVHYHFKTKKGLMGAVAERLAENRTENWRAAFDAPSAQEAVNSTWTLLTDESTTGVTRAWHSLLGSPEKLPDGLAKKLSQRFADCLCDAFATLLRDKLGMAATVPAEEIGYLFDAIVSGIGQQLMSGVEDVALEGAFAAGWLGMLSLTQPAPNDDDGGDV